MTNTQAYQEFLGKLYTNSSFREAFFDNPTTTQLAYQLDKAFVSQLVTQKEAIERFADSLIRKRLHAIHDLLPLTHRFLGNSFHAHFRRYAAEHHTDGIHRYHKDAIQFLAYIEKIVLPTQENQSLLKNIIKLERTRNQIWAKPHQSIISILNLNYTLAYLNTPEEWHLEAKTSKTWWFFICYRGRIVLDSVF